MVAMLHLRGTVVDGLADGLEQLLGEGHHPVVVLILHIELHAGKLGVVELVHTLVAEVLTDLIDTLKSAYDQSLQIELGGDTHVHIDVEGVEMGDEGAGRGASGDGLEGRGLYLGIAVAVEEGAHGAEHGGTLEEGVLHAVVDDEIDIAATGAQLGVVKLVVGHAVLVLDDGQRLEALRQEDELLGVDADLAHLGLEDEATHADEVADVEQFLEDYVV